MDLVEVVNDIDNGKGSMTRARSTLLCQSLRQEIVHMRCLIYLGLSLESRYRPRLCLKLSKE